MNESIRSLMERREFIRTAAAGTVITAIGGGYVLAGEDDPRTKEKRPDGKPRLPPGQRLLSAMKPMGGDPPGDASVGAFRLKVHGEVEKPFEVDFAGLLALPQSEIVCDVHCVTGWSAFDLKWTGVKISDLAKQAKIKSSAKHVVFESANDYTANVRLGEALGAKVAIVHKLDGKSIPLKHGPPARSLVPDLYFWKSAKWVTGVRFVATDKPGYWETRGYHNHADPWLEERYG